MTVSPAAQKLAKLTGRPEAECEKRIFDVHAEAQSRGAFTTDDDVVEALATVLAFASVKEEEDAARATVATSVYAPGREPTVSGVLGFRRRLSRTA